MAQNIYREVLRLAGSIEDPYLRAVTYARIGYYLYRAREPSYKEAFARALNAVASIENPLFLVKSLIEVGTFFARIGSKTADKIFHQAYESIRAFPQPLKDELLGELSLRLVELGKASDAQFYATEIENPVKRNDVLLKVLHSYLHADNLRKAKGLLNAITEEPWHSIASFEVLKEHLRREEFGSAIRVLSELESDYWLGEAMKTVAGYLKKSDVPPETYEKFVNIALGMSPEKQEEVLRALLIGLAVQGEVNFILGILQRLGEDARKNLIGAIVVAISDRPEVLLEFLQKGPRRDDLYTKVMDELLGRRPDEDYIEIVKFIGDNTRSEKTLVKVVRYLSKLGEFEKAWKLASKVDDPYLRSLAFGGIAVEKLKKNDIGGAIDAALEVRDKHWGSWLLSEILAKILELQTEEVLSEDLENRAEEHRALWERD
ncbi:hypothetical protein [Thermococcus sp.]|uniref:hypothetical protein n=1 Tax=Thermococcus sp. TaxID=35749 RepID=UPI00260DFB1A|nr:hypothetical protein [Thermococcus sp.]